MVIRRTFFSGLLCFLIFSSLALATTEPYPIDQVYPGLMGIGKTVVQGTEIEEFDVEVIGVIPQPAPTLGLVMVRVSGNAIDLAGGIASGMSGSPVYIDDKLLGAIGYGYEYSDHKVGLVTPAESMLAIVNYLPDVELEIPEGFTELQTPLMVTGIHGRGFELLENALIPYNTQLLPAVSGITNKLDDVKLEPGSAFGVQLLRGDFQVVAFGTITDVDELNRFIGFGHSFLHKGDVSFFAAPAMVHYIMPNLEVPFKIASAGASVGGVYQDRSAGVAGILGKEPNYIPINIIVEDRSQDRTGEYQVEAVTDSSLISALAISSVYQGVDSTLDRIGSGTAYVRLEFFVEELLNPVVRENMFYSDADIAVWALSDLSEGIELITANNLQEINLEKINTEIVIEDTRKTAEIEKAVPRKFQVAAGDSVEVDVKIRPYRRPVESRILRIDIPEDTLPGLMTVSFRGGGSGYYNIKPTVHTTWESLEAELNDELRLEPTGAENLDILLAKYMNREQNNEIIAEFYPFIDTFSAEEGSSEMTDTIIHDDESIPVSEVELLEQDFGSFQWNDSGNEPVRVRLTTQYVIDGSASFEIEVL